MGNAIFAAALGVIVGGIAKAREGSDDVVIKVEKIVDLVDVDAGIEAWVEGDFLVHLLFQAVEETV